MWHEMANYLSAIDMYVLSLACKAGRKNYMHLFPHAVFDVTEMSLRNAWTILPHLHNCQLLIPNELRQVEILHNRKIITNVADWAARRGHLMLLQWLLLNTEEGCTTYAMDLAARNGHMNVLSWLHSNGLGGCTSAAADWAAFKGRLNIIKWLYENTGSRCSEHATMIAAGNGDMETLLWLHGQGVSCNPSCANMAFACGHACTLQFLESIGCKQCVDKADNNTIHNIRRIIEYERRPCKRRD